MTNILYGVNGEGSGHASRSREVLRHLVGKGHAVHVVSFDRGLKNLAADFPVTEIFGLRLSYVHNRVRYRKTLLRNLLAVPQAVRSIRAVERLVRDKQIELVITDFEPVSCHVARKLHLPVISIDNQHCLVNCEISYPREYRKEAAAAKAVSRLMTSHADAYLVTSFFTPRITRQDTQLFPPILRNEVLQAAPAQGEDVVVYVTSPAEDLVRVLKSVRQSFVCYGFSREGREENLLFKKPGMDAFLRDLAAARAVIANAGFSLISEALFLGKPYLAWPVQDQFEQVFNAYYIQEMGYGAWWDDLNKERVESFLFNLDFYRRNLAQYLRADNAALFAAVDKLIAKYTR